jgi:hypothetical protein
LFAQNCKEFVNKNIIKKLDCQENSFVKTTIAKGGKLKGFFLTGFGFNTLDETLKLEKLSILNDSLLNSDLEPLSSDMTLKQIAEFAKHFQKEDLPHD